MVAEVFPEPLVELDAPPFVDMACRRDGDKLLVHLTNTTGMQTAEHYTIIDTIPAIGPIKLKIRLDKTPSSVSLVPADSPIEVVEMADGIQVTIASIAIHNVLVIQ